MRDNVDYYTAEVIKFFQIRAATHGNIMSGEIQVKCPYHNDERASASINITKKVFNCFAGCGGRTFERLYNEVINGNKLPTVSRNSVLDSLNNFNYNYRSNLPEVPQTESQGQINPTQFKIQLGELLTQQSGQSFRILQEVSDDVAISALQSLIKSKGILPETLESINATPVVNRQNQHYGYIEFPNNGGSVYRKFLPDEVLEGPRYVNSKGEKLYYGTISDKYKDYILVEGIFDYLSLLQEGYQNVICNLGSEMNEKRAYKFKSKVVFILFDNDFAGYQGTKKASAAIRMTGGHPIVLDLPEHFGKDVNEAINKDKAGFFKWLNSYINKFDDDDSNYIDNFGSEETLYTLKTHLNSFNTVLKGGPKVGMHIFAAEPAVGKTALMLDFADEICKLNPNAKGLYLTYEVPKKQCWSRIASKYDSRSWADIELDSILEPQTKLYLKQLSKQLRIESFWTMSEVMRVSDEYDFFMFDYLQCMPGDSDDTRSNCVRNLKLMSRLAMEKDKIIFAVSSISRAMYGKEELGIFKETGDTEYKIQSGFLLSKINDGGLQRMIKVTCLKNTRGPMGGNFWIEGNMIHNKFKDTTAIKLDSEDGGF